MAHLSRESSLLSVKTPSFPNNRPSISSGSDFKTVKNEKFLTSVIEGKIEVCVQVIVMTEKEGEKTYLREQKIEYKKEL